MHRPKVQCERQNTKNPNCTETWAWSANTKDRQPSHAKPLSHPHIQVKFNKMSTHSVVHYLHIDWSTKTQYSLSKPLIPWQGGYDVPRITASTSCANPFQKSFGHCNFNIPSKMPLLLPSNLFTHSFVSSIMLLQAYTYFQMDFVSSILYAPA